MDVTLPERLVKFVPDGHRLWFSPKNDPELSKPEALRNKNALGGTNRRDWIVCVCGGAKLVEGGPPTDLDWLEAVNQCRLSTHSARRPCLPVDLEGIEQPLRDAPPPVETKSVTTPPVELGQPTGKRLVGRPRKEELAHA